MDLPAAQSTQVVLGTKPEGPPIACTLDPNAIPAQLDAWKAVLDGARSRSRMPDGALRVEFDDDVDLHELTRLAAAEQSCCAFFAFAITIDGRGTALEVRAPDDAADLVATMFDS